MPHLGRWPVLAVAALMATQTGCITLFSKTEVIRSDEPRRPIRFNTPEAADAFYEGMKCKCSAVQGGSHVGIPCVTIYSKNSQLSPSAHFNECVAKCDLDLDGVITLEEAESFKKRSD